MKNRVCVGLFLFCLLGGISFAQSNTLHLLPANSWESNQTHQVVWETTPGVRYELQQSGTLTNWSAVAGYPTQAVQYADAHAFNVVSNLASAQFFKVLEYDEQAPSPSKVAPYDGAFAITRFNSPISLTLSDVSGVDPSSISMTVGGLGAFTLADGKLSYTNGLLTFDMGGDTALGPYGTNVQVSLVAADVNGYMATNSWTFDLELEADVATNLFVFGSPDAQRAGQRIGNIPTRVLAERAAGDPIRMSGGADPWELEEVFTNGLIIAYTGANAPAFNMGDYLANLTPATVDEIFYRQITGMYDDTVQKKLILFTEEARLTDIVEEGTAAITEDSMVLEVSTNGTIVSARAVEKAWDFTVPLPKIGYSLDGETFSATGLSLTTEECHFWLQPSLEVALEIKLNDVERFAAIVHGDIESALICDVTAQAGTSCSETIYDLPQSLQPRTIVTLGTIGVPPIAVPVFAEIGLDLKLDADMDANASMNFRYGFRQNIKAEFGVVFENDDFDWRKIFTPEDPERVPFTSTINGELGMGLTLRPSIYVVVLDAFGQGCAGIETGPAVRGGIRFETEGADLAGYLEGKADWELGTRGWAFALFDPKPALPPWTIWGPEEWKLFPEATDLLFTKHPSSQVVDYGASAYLSCSVSSSKSVGYQWYHNGTILPNETSRTLIFQNVTQAHAGDYYVRANAGSEFLNSDVVILKIMPSGGDPSAISWKFINARWVKNTYANGDVTMSDKATGQMWLFDANYAGMMDWYAATQYCNSLNYAGHSDWELPSKNILLSLTTELSHFINYNYGNPYWSITAFPDYGPEGVYAPYVAEGWDNPDWKYYPDRNFWPTRNN